MFPIMPCDHELAMYITLYTLPKMVLSIAEVEGGIIEEKLSWHVATRYDDYNLPDNKSKCYAKIILDKYGIKEVLNSLWRFSSHAAKTTSDIDKKFSRLCQLIDMAGMHI